MVDEEDRLKTTFMIKWGTFSYKRMPFGLINAVATFQRAMDKDFKGLINKCIVIYMDDLTIFSKYQSTHITNLRQVFNRCLKYDISLSPKKCSLGVTKVKLLGHFISEDRISIDPGRIEDILKLSLPHSQKELKSLFGNINFVQKFISGFAEIVHPLNDLLKKGAKT